MKGLVVVSAVAALVLAMGTLPASSRHDGKPGGRESSVAPRATQSAAAVFPLKLSNNRRYLVDQRNRPFLVMGDAPQALIGNLSVADARAYIANRRAAGFDALWVNLLCVKYTGCRSDGTTYDGVAPFTVPGDLSRPNPKYFARADAMLTLAERAGIVVFLDPIETGGWLSVLRTNGVAKAFAYGQFLGRRFGHRGNIIWLSGNDFQTWQNPSDDALVLAVAKGIRSVDKAHLQTVELNYLESGSLDDARWQPLLGVDSAYTYGPTYARVLGEYNRSGFVPVVMIEAGYEFEQNMPALSKGTADVLRRQAYWSVLSGATGQIYGNHYTWPFANGWKNHLDTPGSRDIGYLVRVFSRRPWFRLVPDQVHRYVTSGYGSFTSQGNVESSDYATTAATPDGSLLMSYLPVGGTVTLDASRLRRRATARWYDPASGAYSPARPLPHSAKVNLTAPGKNHDGDSDWLLVVTAP